MPFSSFFVFISSFIFPPFFFPFHYCPLSFNFPQAIISPQGRNIFLNKYPFTQIFYKYGGGENMKEGKDIRERNGGFRERKGGNEKGWK